MSTPDQIKRQALDSGVPEGEPETRKKEKILNMKVASSKVLFRATLLLQNILD